MDLFMKIGVLFLMLTMLSLVFYFGTNTYIQGSEVNSKLTKPEVSYTMDSTITRSTFYLDTRAFIQWALTTKEHRNVYLMYKGFLTPDEKLYGEYMYQLDVTKDKTDPSDRNLVIQPKTNKQVNNSILISDQSPKIISILEQFNEEAKKSSSKKIVTVHTFVDSKSSEVRYLCYIEGVI